MGNIAAKPKTSPRGGLKAYLDRVGALPAVRSDGDRGRLIFALDATGSRKRRGMKRADSKRICFGRLPLSAASICSLFTFRVTSVRRRSG